LLVREESEPRVKMCLAHLTCALLLLGSTAFAASPIDDHAGRDLEDLRKRIQSAQKDLATTEESRIEAADALKRSEQSISDATRTIRKLGEQEGEAQASLKALLQAQTTEEDSIQKGQSRLADLLRYQYANAGQDTLPLLLSGENPEQIARDTEYLKHIAAARQKAVASLQEDLDRLQVLKKQAEDKAHDIAKMREARAKERSKLQQESAAHAKVVAELSTKLQAQKRNLQTMERDEKRLTQLVERIARALEERRKQKEKAQREAREAKERAARETPSAPPAASSSGGNIQAKPPESVARIDENAEEGYDTEAFPKMKGKLRLPVTGELANRFGSPREDSTLNWRGLFIRAPQGREVHAVASGRVVFSDWLRGFGNLLILDHGGGYMSLYGNTESLFARVGDVVKGGVVIASVGNSGGNAEAGLYFELRYQSKPFDPMIWAVKH
jgi:murein hydrolase activator